MPRSGALALVKQVSCLPCEEKTTNTEQEALQGGRGTAAAAHGRRAGALTCCCECACCMHLNVTLGSDWPASINGQLKWSARQQCGVGGMPSCRSARPHRRWLFAGPRRPALFASSHSPNLCASSAARQACYARAVSLCSAAARSPRLRSSRQLAVCHRCGMQRASLHACAAAAWRHLAAAAAAAAACTVYRVAHPCLCCCRMQMGRGEATRRRKRNQEKAALLKGEVRAACTAAGWPEKLQLPCAVPASPP